MTDPRRDDPLATARRVRPTHTCPRPGCQVTVANHLYACRSDWFALSKATRDLIWATAHLPVFDPERQAAFRAADEDWERRTP